MSIKISYINKSINKPSSNVVLFVNEKFNAVNLKRYVSNSEFSYIKDLLQTSDLKKKNFSF